jgi:beta-glucosidase
MHTSKKTPTRREFVKTGSVSASVSALGLGGLTAVEAKATKTPKSGRFPKDFLWGVATAAYQIEGAHNIDGKGESIWDRFVLAPKKIKNGDTGNVACDSYNRLDEDVALLKALGVQSYRFSISWPRVQAEGAGAFNPLGIDYYKRLSDALLKANIRPLATLYHWDLPQALEDRGGWPVRATADRFSDYALEMVKALGGNIKHWAIFNEPKTFVELGYLNGTFAPGRKDPETFLAATHVVNLAQGQAFQAMKAQDSALHIGTALDVSPIYTATNSPEDKLAAERQHAFTNLWYLLPALTGAYPQGVLPEDQMALLKIKDGDDQRVRAPFDFLGLNNYTRSEVKYDPTKTTIPGLKTAWVWGDGQYEKTDIGWAVPPGALYDIIKKIHEVTGPMPIEITENGACYNTGVDETGSVRDEKRIAYYRMCLNQVSQAIGEGVPIRGYHAWSLMDNFEWAQGYAMRFGLVHVDFKTQKRTIKDSGAWYAKVIKANRVI